LVDHDLLLSLSVDGDWLVALDVSWATPSGVGAAALEGAEDDDAESDDGAGDAGDEGDAGAAELVGGGSDDVLWRSPHAPSSKPAASAIDSVESFIVFPFNEFMDEHQCGVLHAYSRITVTARCAAHHRHDTDAPVGHCRRLRIVCNSAWLHMLVRCGRQSTLRRQRIEGAALFLACVHGTNPATTNSRT
jgi:hypothetical protein